jgi:hypothetical protein
VRGIYLNNYLRWDSKAQHEQMIDAYGYESMPQQRTFDTYHDVDCFHYSGLHDYVKFVKRGYGKVSDHASRELRLKRLTREQAIDMVERYQSVPPADTAMFLEWLGMSAAEFWNAIDTHRDPAIWERSDRGWQLRDSVINHRTDAGVDAVRLGVIEANNFRVTGPRQPGATEQDYVLIGRGWVDQR